MDYALGILDRANQYIVDPAILLIFSVGFFLFIWGLIVFISNPEDMTKRKTGIQHMIWGIVGMFIMIAVDGIIDLIVGTFDLQFPPQPFSSGGGGNVPPGGFPSL
jgi:hypothetical protein